MKQLTMLKQFFSLALAFVLLLGTISFSPVTIAAETTVAEDSTGIYTYTIAENDGATITGVTAQLQGEITIPSTLDGYPVTRIAASVFEGQDALTGVTVPEGVVVIEQYAFYDCTNLTEISLPDSLNYVGWGAFSFTGYYNEPSNWENDMLCLDGWLVYARWSLQGECMIPSGTRYIAESVFKNNAGITSVVIPDSVIAIGMAAFYNCTALQSVVMEEGVKEIGWQAFDGCTSLASVTLPDSVTVIDYCAFDDTAYYNDAANWEEDVLYIGNHLLEAKNVSGTFAIREGTVSIGYGAFEKCTAMTGVAIPDSMTYIGGSAFSGCTGLAEITIPEGVSAIGDYAFFNCKRLQQVVIPASVCSLGYSAFAYCSNLHEVILSEGVQELGDSAFYACTGLTKVTIPASVTKIDAQVFTYCTRLQSIQVAAENPAYLSDDGILFNKDKTKILCYPSEKPDLSEYTIPDTVEYIGGGAFYFCEVLENIIIPDSVKIIGKNAFANCRTLTTITIPDSVFKIEYGAFSYCLGLEKIAVPDSVTEMGSSVFLYCTNLTDATLPDNWTEIPDSTFMNCENLTEFTVSDHVTSLGWGAFYGCTNLMEITLPDGLTTIGNDQFYNCISLQEIRIPESVTEISYRAFYGCESLTHVTIPEGMTEIDYGLFYGCTALQSVTLPETVTYIDDYAFSECTNLTTVNYSGTEAQWKEMDFGVYNKVVRTAAVNYNYGKLPFTDVAKDQWYYDTIKEAYELGLMYGATDTLFRPNVPMTRGMMAAVLHRVAGSPAVTFTKRFPDVAAVDWYAIPVSWAASKGVINGYNSGRFAPNDNVTREQVATMLCNYAKFVGKYTKASDTVLEKFNDEQKISSYAVESMQWAVANGLISGKDNGIRLDPQGTATRAECTKMLLQLYKLLQK